MNIIEFRDFWWKYESSTDWILRGVNLEVEQGEFLAITGPSGSGKTTLCQCLNGIIPHSHPGVVKGEVYVAGIRVRDSTVPQLCDHVGMMFQDPESQFIGMSVEEEVVFGPENLGLPREEIERRMVWALKVVGMEGMLDRAPYELSGGQKQRVAIASALVMLPQILVLDEPTSELDPIGKSEVFSIVSELRRDRKMTIIMVEHETEEVAKYADRVILLREGTITAGGPTQDFLSDVEGLKDTGVEPPQVTQFAHLLAQDGLVSGKLPITLEDARDRITQIVQNRKKGAVLS
jgi:energy-coupling factor transport system ATP-binding protein